MDSPLSATLCERLQIDLDPRRRGRTWIRARSPARWSPVRGAHGKAWRRGGNDLAFWCGRREGSGGGEVVEKSLALRGCGGTCNGRGALCRALKPQRWRRRTMGGVQRVSLG